MSTLFGGDYSESGFKAASWFGGKPSDTSVKPMARTGPENKMVAWSRRANATLKQFRQEVTDEMQRATNMARGSTPWWKSRPKWKIGTNLNYAATIPLTWTAILCDAKPTVSYSALDRSKQKKADIATAAWNQAYVEGKWEQKIHDAVLVSRVQKKAYLRLTYDALAHGGRGRPKLAVVLGEQVYLDPNATCIDDAETVLYEYRESYGSLCERFPDLRDKLQRKYVTNRTAGRDENQSVLSPPAAYNFTDVGGTGTVYTPAYAASQNPPEAVSSGGTGMLVREFWTRPHKTIEVEEIQFLSTGEPATRPKFYETIDPLDSEPMRLVLTEGNVLYELPESIVMAMREATDGIQILEESPCLEVLTHRVKYPLYPDGRLVTIVDEDLLPDDGDTMNPLGYFPFAEIFANADPGGGQYGPSDVDLIAAPFEQLVRLVSIVFDNANLAGNSIWRVWEGDPLSNDDFTNAPGGILRETIQSLRFSKRESPPELPGYILNHIKFLVEQINELSGLSDMMKGKMPPKAQVSTETVTLSQEASGVRFRDALGSVSRCMQTLGEQFLELMARFYTSPVIVQIKSDAGVPEPVPMLGSYLTDKFVVEAKAGSRQPAGPSARLTTLLNLKNAGIPVSMDTIFGLAEELGVVPSATAAMRLIETQMNDPSQKWKVLGLGGPPQQSKKPSSRRSKKQGAAAG